MTGYLFGIITLAIVLVLILLGRSSLRQAYKLECFRKEGRQIPGLREEIKDLFRLSAAPAHQV